MSSMHMLFAVSECEFVFVYVCFEILPDPCFMRRAMPARAMTAAAPNQLTPNVARRYVMLPSTVPLPHPPCFCVRPFLSCAVPTPTISKNKKSTLYLNGRVPQVVPQVVPEPRSKSAGKQRVVEVRGRIR